MAEQPAFEIGLEEAYNKAHQGTILVDRSQLGMLKFTGETRLDLINRMSTQDVLSITNHQGAATVLTKWLAPPSGRSSRSTDVTTT